ncbi:MAG: M48 family metallopeptidase [Deltaproteobacteria bacterium]|nr:M48 family metallopeptidase [Deltaproteobacteria bacterium]
MADSTMLLYSFLIIFVISAFSRWILTQINVAHLRRHGSRVPDVFAGEIDQATLAKMSAYTAESSRFGSFESIFSDIVLLIALLGGFFPWLNGMIQTPGLHFIFSGLLFFGILALLSTLIGIPFDLYGTFGIEKKYGFSTITPKLWMIDFIKGLFLSAILIGILLSAFLALIYYAKNYWWFLVWVVFASFQLLMLWLYPIVIAPIFNKYEPVKNEALKDALIALMAKAGLKTEGVYQVDEGKRSKHSNAYFTGLGSTKRIVLYDTLLASHTNDEIISILAHEIGHWKKKHMIKQLVFMEAASLAALYAASHLLEWSTLYETFGFSEVIPYAGLLLLAVIAEPLTFFLTPLASMAIRRFEREADDYSFMMLGTAKPMCDAVKRLAKDNLANLHPHPFYVWFYYSHPPLTERIHRLQDMEKQDFGG